MEIVAVGFDEPATNQAWAEDQGYQFEIWTDQDKTLAVYYGAAASTSAAVPSRVTKILDEAGTLILEYQVSDIGTHPAQVLEDCQLLFGD